MRIRSDYLVMSPTRMGPSDAKEITANASVEKIVSYQINSLINSKSQ